MFKKILLPLDGSKTAEQALLWAKQYAGPQKAQVVLLQILHAEYPLKGRPFRAWSTEARDYLQSIERELNYAGIPAKILLRNEPVARSIVETARRESCDLILMTSRGASHVVRWLIGGVTQQVMRLSPIPVFVVRSAVGARKPGRPRRILVPQDGSPRARAILPLAASLAAFHRARLELLHVCAAKEPSADVGRRLLRQRARLQRQGIRASLRFEEGDPAEGILKACRPDDLLALTTHGRGGIKRLLLGSVAEKVIYQAPVSVVVYKEPSPRVPLPQEPELLDVFDR
jgi:nucleotide-binding universal stress UspA family protein